MDNKILPIGEANSPDAHFLHVREAAEMVRAYQAHPDKASLPMFNHTTFHGEAIRALHAHPEFAAERSALGLHNGRVVLIKFAVNKQGSIIGDLALQNGESCPPLCR